MRGECGQFHFGAARQVEGERPVDVPEADELVVWARERAVVLVEAGDAGRVAAAVKRERDWQKEADVVVDMLDVDVETPALELTRQANADLAALVLREAGIAHALVRPVETANRQAPAVADRRAVEEVGAIESIVADLGLDHAFGFVAGLARDEVDGAAGRVRREDRRRAAAHGFHPADRLVEPERLVGVEPAEAAVVLDGEAVFENRHG